MTGPAHLDDGAFRSMIGRVPYGVVVHGPDGTIEYANAAAGRLVGVGQEDSLVGRPISDLFAPPFLKGAQAALVGAEDGPVVAVRDELVCSNGQRIPVELAAIPYLADATHLAVQLIFHDISARVRAEAAVARTDAYLRVLVEKVPVVMWTADANGKVTWWHGPGMGGPTRPPVGREPEDVLGVEDAAPLSSAQRRALAGSPSSCELRASGRSLAAYLEPLRSPGDPTVLGTVGIAVDNTEHRRLEAQRREDQRLDAVAHLAGGVAHEMNNILGTVVAFATVLRDEETIDRRRDDLDAIVDAAERGSRVASDLLGFSHGGMYRRVLMGGGALLTAVAEFARERSRGAVRVEVDVPVDPVPIEGDPRQLALAIEHVVENALSAMPEGGTLTLALSRIALGVADVPSPSVCPGDYAAIRIADTGTGMTDEVRERAFEPYYTTPATKGRGLGLSMVHGVARHHDGFVRLESGLGQGTTVTLYLPTVDRPLPSPGPTPAPAQRGARGRVLLVDDDDAFRRGMRRVLEHARFVVTDAADGTTALDLYSVEPWAYRFVVLDLRMPTMSGAEVLRRLLQVDPNVGVILCSGYDRDQVTQSLFTLGRVGFLPKPFSLGDLETEIDRLASR